MKFYSNNSSKYSSVLELKSDKIEFTIFYMWIYLVELSCLVNTLINNNNCWMLNWVYLFVQEVLQHQDFSKFQLIKPRLLEVVDKMLAEDISRLMAQIPHEETAAASEPLIKGMPMHCLYFNTTFVTFYLVSSWLH